MNADAASAEAAAGAPAQRARGAASAATCLRNSGRAGAGRTLDTVISVGAGIYVDDESIVPNWSALAEVPIERWCCNLEACRMHGLHSMICTTVSTPSAT